MAEALRDATRRLEATSDTARLDAELLMAHALGVSRSELLLRHMQADVPGEFAGLVIRRATHEPVAYMTGQQEFYGREFRVTPAVLIPRSDSETTIGAALGSATPGLRVLDCGIGSGALLLTFLAERADARGVGIDRSSEALKVASDNASRLGLSDRLELKLADWTTSHWKEGLGTFDLILCNPPYVEDEAELDPDVRNFEPAGALFAGPEGLDDYRVLLRQLPRLLNECGIAVCEIGAAQAEAVTAMARSSGFSEVLHCDLAGRARALVLSI